MNLPIVELFYVKSLFWCDYVFYCFFLPGRARSVVAGRHSGGGLLAGVAEILVDLCLGLVVPADGVGHHVAATARSGALGERRLPPHEHHLVSGAGGSVATANAAPVHTRPRVQLQITADVLKKNRKEEEKKKYNSFNEILYYTILYMVHI